MLPEEADGPSSSGVSLGKTSATRSLSKAPSSTPFPNHRPQLNLNVCPVILFRIKIWNRKWNYLLSLRLNNQHWFHLNSLGYFLMETVARKYLPDAYQLKNKKLTQSRNHFEGLILFWFKLWPILNVDKTPKFLCWKISILWFKIFDKSPRRKWTAKSSEVDWLLKCSLKIP